MQIQRLLSSPYLSNTIAALVSAEDHAETTHFRLPASAYEALNEIVRVSNIPETSGIIAQLLEDIMRTLNLTFDLHILSSVTSFVVILAQLTIRRSGGSQSALENHKYEIADWDLGAGIYIDFYGSLEEMSESCRSFFGRLNESLLVWGSKLPVESRACYSKMAEELCALLVDTPSETLNLLMGCLLTMLNAPVPDESRSSYLQDTLSVFTEILCSDP
uniref:Uncharacterized protein n=1 Tax=Zea mays TaxID=4577 RepID=A0A804PG92_MAIZE